MKRLFAVAVAVLILALGVIPAFAANNSERPSPTPSREYNVVVHNTNGGTATYTTTIDEDGKHVLIVAHPKNGYEFDHWVIDGKYIIEDGSLTDEELRLLLKGDIVVTPVFKKIGSSSTSSGSKTSISSNPSPVSPQTGDNALFFAIAAFVILAAAFGAVGVKLAVSKNKK